MTTLPEPLERMTLEAPVLMSAHPPVWRDRNKRVVFEISSPPGTTHTGQVRYTRWPASSLPDRITITPTDRFLEERHGLYDYLSHPGYPNATEWHVNFADPHLFFGYGSRLFAQDEIQATEHPALGALREALLAEGRAALTVEGDRPTPVLVMGVERRCHVATAPNAAEGRPDGLYGNAFGRASEDAIRRATRAIVPPTVSNLIAMAALSGGYGSYSRQEIEHVLVTAFTGFSAATIESGLSREERRPVVVHTGFWGCGAFGGNRVLMATLQALAASMAGLDRLVFHSPRAAGHAALAEARGILDRDLAGDSPWSSLELLDRITAMRFEWGESDGN